MTSEEKQEYINYRLNRAFETFDDAEILAQNKRWNSCVNRLYYACFYAVTALLVKNDIAAYTHNGVKTQFGLHFIKTGILPTSYGQLFADLFDWRHRSDYGDFYDFKEEDTLQMLSPVKDLLVGIQKIINSEK